MSGAGASIGAHFRGSVGSFSLEVSFQAPMRGITALFGPSGCGKTTVLRCMAGLRRMPGSLTVGGEVWQDDRAGVFRKPYERSLGYVFQEASLFPHLSVRANLEYGARRAIRGRRQSVLQFEEVVRLLGIAPLLDRSPAALSGGERQRVAVGRALLSQPRLLLMDEPLSGLDHRAKEEILPYLEGLHDELATPILYVSHDIREVARLADTMVVMSSGRIVDSGPIQEVLESLDLEPWDEGLETGVLLDATVVAHDARFRMTRLDHHGQTISIPAADLPVGEQVRLRVRARDVVVATTRPRDISIRNVLSGTVAEVSVHEATPFVDVLVDVGGGRLRATITRDALAELALAVGARAYAMVKSVTFERPVGGQRTR